jgi:molecular chaperone DnaK
MLLSVINMSKKYEIDNIILIGGPTQIPLLYEKLFSMVKINDKEIATSVISKNNLLYKTIVADGACLLNKLGRLDNDITLLDIIPMNIGLSGQDNKLSIMIKKNSKIPTSVENTFTTSYDCQRNIDILVYEGNDEGDCLNNSLIGSYKIIGIPPLPKGKILIKLLFKITYNGILNISIIGFKNPFDDNSKSFDYKFNNNIRLISSYMAKDLLKKLLNLKK